jgi:hypothetical protein
MGSNRSAMRDGSKLAVMGSSLSIWLPDDLVNLVVSYDKVCALSRERLARGQCTSVCARRSERTRTRCSNAHLVLIPTWALSCRAV